MPNSGAELLSIPYRHTQKAPYLWFVIPFLMLVALIPVRLDLTPGVALIWGVNALLCGVMASCVLRLTIEEQDEELRAYFGPIRVLGTRVRFSEIESFEIARSRFYEGWGMRFTLSGMLYNIWGFDCVRITTAKRSFRLGTNDVPGLLALLERRAGKTDRENRE